MKFDLDHVPEEIFWDLSEDEAIELGMPWWGKIIYWSAYALQFISPLIMVTALCYGSITTLLLSITLPTFLFMLLAYVNNNLENYYFERGLEVLVKRYYEERER